MSPKPPRMKTFGERERRDSRRRGHRDGLEKRRHRWTDAQDRNRGQDTGNDIRQIMKAAIYRCCIQKKKDRKSHVIAFSEVSIQHDQHSGGRRAMGAWDTSPGIMMVVAQPFAAPCPESAFQRNGIVAGSIVKRTGYREQDVSGKTRKEYEGQIEKVVAKRGRPPGPVN